ncbi:hypothetical protein B005_4181 [Nocardiopsis alba ATCC BAA-2165]|uniref:Uncharacterized protein n=1 Tax=Nocardiopsis alba (strain ATCC BAA-2165 / BE74) TaxID=1205910 RepID=J7LEE9_NOCAA|nr:hypothetical protein B005_4181 [Nocardiopsis alba ATCC BAA-2165]
MLRLRVSGGHVLLLPERKGAGRARTCGQSRGTASINVRV